MTEPRVRRKCASCGSAMSPGYVPDDRGGGPVIEIDGCPKCGATFFDGGELERIAAKVIVDFYAEQAKAATRCWKCGAALPPPPGGRPSPVTCGTCGARSGRPCPSCATPMGVLDHGKVLVDVCGNCRGIFLDRGEFEQVLGMPGEPLRCVSCGSTSFEPRHAFFGESGMLCESCYATREGAAGAAAGPGSTPAAGGIRRVDVTRFFAEYLRLRTEPGRGVER